MSILAILDAFCTYKAQSEAIGNMCGINTRWTGSVVQRLSALFMLGNYWKCFTTSSSSLNHKDKQSVLMHKEEKEKSWDTCVSGRFYKVLIKAGPPTAWILPLSLQPAMPQSTMASQNRDTALSKTKATLTQRNSGTPTTGTKALFTGLPAAMCWLNSRNIPLRNKKAVCGQWLAGTLILMPAWGITQLQARLRPRCCHELKSNVCLQWKGFEKETDNCARWGVVSRQADPHWQNVQYLFPSASWPCIFLLSI